MATIGRIVGSAKRVLNSSDRVATAEGVATRVVKLVAIGGYIMQGLKENEEFYGKDESKGGKALGIHERERERVCSLAGINTE